MLLTDGRGWHCREAALPRPGTTGQYIVHLPSYPGLAQCDTEMELVVETRAAAGLVARAEPVQVVFAGNNKRRRSVSQRVDYRDFFTEDSDSNAENRDINTSSGKRRKSFSKMRHSPARRRAGVKRCRARERGGGTVVGPGGETNPLAETVISLADVAEVARRLGLDWSDLQDLQQEERNREDLAELLSCSSLPANQPGGILSEKEMEMLIRDLQEDQDWLQELKLKCDEVWSGSQLLSELDLGLGKPRREDVLLIEEILSSIEL